MHISHFCMEGIWDHVAVHWQQDKFQSWANYLMYWMAAPNRGSQFVIGAPTAFSSVLTTRPWPIHKKQQRSVLAVRYHTPGTTQSRFLTLHWAACSWRWHIDIFSYGAWGSPCSGGMVNFNCARNVADAGYQPQTADHRVSKAPPPPTAVSGVLTTRS